MNLVMVAPSMCQSMNFSVDIIYLYYLYHICNYAKTQKLLRKIPHLLCEAATIVIDKDSLQKGLSMRGIAASLELEIQQLQ